MRSVVMKSRSSEALEVRYVFATARHMSSLVATHQKSVYYSSSLSGQDHTALPQGQRRIEA